jgi:peptidylprolyl isomerase
VTVRAGEGRVREEVRSDGDTVWLRIDTPAVEVLERDPPEPVPPAADTPPGSLETTTLIEGHGPPAADGDSLRVHYVLVTADGTVVDSSWERGEPFPLTLGAGEVIAGWDQGLVGARTGERRRLVVGSDLAYGHEGSSGDDVPPDAPLAFEVDVVEILPGG